MLKFGDIFFEEGHKYEIIIRDGKLFPKDITPPAYPSIVSMASVPTPEEITKMYPEEQQGAEAMRLGFRCIGNGIKAIADNGNNDHLNDRLNLLRLVVELLEKDIETQTQTGGKTNE